MSANYTVQAWADNDATKPVSAARMTYLETGITAVDTAAQTAAAAALVRSNHSGTQLSTTISDFAAAVAANSTDLGIYTPQSGQWITPDNFQGGSATGAMTQGTLSLVPIDIGHGGFTLAAIGINVTTAAVGGATVGMRLGIYADNGTGGCPGALVVDAGLASLAATGNASVANTTVLTAGRYWLGAAYQYGTIPTTAPQITGYGSSLRMLPGTTLASTYRSWQVSAVTGALPGTITGAATFSSASYLVGLKA
jgi:hypothetical protein